MGQRQAEEIADAIGAPEQGSWRPARKPKRWIWVSAVAVVLFPVFWPLLFFGAIAVLMVGSTPFAFYDEHVNSNPLTPGRWESGEYWVELESDGTGSLRLPVSSSYPDSGFPADEGERVVTADLTWHFIKSADGTYGDLRLDVDESEYFAPNVGWAPFLTGAGMWGGGYNWEQLLYSKGDPDVVDVSLNKVSDE